MNIEEILKRIDSVIDCLTESDGGNAVTESDVKDAKVELNELKEQLALHNVVDRLPEDTVIRDNAREMDEKEFEHWWWEAVYKSN